MTSSVGQRGELWLFNRVLAVIAVVTITGLACAAPFQRFTLADVFTGADPTGLLRIPALLVVLLVGVWFYRRRQLTVPENVLMITFWAIVIVHTQIAAMYLASRNPLEHQDALLARWDRVLGVEVPDVMAWVAAHPPLKLALDGVYETIMYLFAIAIFMPPLLGKMRVAKEFMFACIVAALIVMPFFWAFHAVGPWVSYGFEPTAQQAAIAPLFELFHSDQVLLLDIGTNAGLICFPSFHVIWAILLGYALWSLPYVRWPGVMMVGLIIISTVTTGWHYVVDGLAGFAVAGVALAAARGYTRLERRFLVS